MWNELGISGGTAIIILIALYFVIKWAVKNGIDDYLDYIQDYYNEVVHEELIRVSIYYI